MKKITKLIASLVITALTFTGMTGKVLAASELMKDGEMLGEGFVNAGEVVDRAVQGPGNWTQINMGDAAVDVGYLHIVMKATGDTSAAQIVVSDSANFKLADLGITLTEEYQDVVLPVQEKGLTMISWINFMGLDGGSSVYSIKDIFLDDSAESTIKVGTENTTGALPKTGESMIPVVIACVVLCGAATVYFMTKERREYTK